MTTIELNSSCTTTGVSLKEFEQIKIALTLPNPSYLEAIRMGRYARNLDHYLRYYRETENGLIVPRGFTGGIYDICGPVHLIDHRRTLEPVNFEFSSTLRDYQTEAVEDVGRFDFGVLEAATGSGKTTIALALIAARQQPTLVIVPTVELMHQWADRAQQ